MHDYDKIPIERLVMNGPTIQGTVLRLPAVYGPNDGQHRLFEFLKRMDDQRPAILLDERWRNGAGRVAMLKMSPPPSLSPSQISVPLVASTMLARLVRSP